MTYEQQPTTVPHHTSGGAKNNGVPAAIIIAGLLIAASIYISNTSGGSASPHKAAQPLTLPQGTAALDKMSPVTSADHILGDINAPVKIVEYSDTECPFCKQFHNTLTDIMATYGKAGKVAWVYRHFPIDGLHPKSRKEAEALECANEQGGNTAFWSYMNRLMEITPSNNGLDPAKLPDIAKTVGLNVDTFTTCLSSGKYAKKVSDSIAEAVATGGNGTPWSIVIGADGTKYPLSGAQPEEVVKQMIDTVGKKK